MLPLPYVVVVNVVYHSTTTTITTAADFRFAINQTVSMECRKCDLSKLCVYMNVLLFYYMEWWCVHRHSLRMGSVCALYMCKSNLKR